MTTNRWETCFNGSRAPGSFGTVWEHYLFSRSCLEKVLGALKTEYYTTCCVSAKLPKLQSANLYSKWSAWQISKYQWEKVPRQISWNMHLIGKNVTRWPGNWNVFLWDISFIALLHRNGYQQVGKLFQWFPGSWEIWNCRGTLPFQGGCLGKFRELWRLIFLEFQYSLGLGNTKPVEKYAELLQNISLCWNISRKKVQSHSWRQCP